MYQDYGVGQIYICDSGLLIVTTSWQTHEYTLTGAQAALITDYSDLNFRVCSSNLGAGKNLLYCWAELEVPSPFVVPTVQTDPATEIT